MTTLESYMIPAATAAVLSARQCTSHGSGGDCPAFIINSLYFHKNGKGGKCRGEAEAALLSKGLGSGMRA